MNHQDLPILIFYTALISIILPISGSGTYSLLIYRLTFKQITSVHYKHKDFTCALENFDFYLHILALLCYCFY